MRRRILALAALGAVALTVLVRTGGEDGFRLRAELGDAEGIRAGYVVRVDGIEAGRVTSVDVTPRDTALVAIRLDPSAGAVGRGATVSARAANLLGEKYLDLQPGDRAHPLGDGTLVPLSRTRSEVQVDDILNMLAPDTRARLRILVNELGIGISGRGSDLNALLQQLPPTLRDGDALLAQLQRENGALGRLIDRADLVLTTVAARRAEPARFVRSADALVGTLAARRRALAGTIQAAPAALRRTRRSLAEIAATARRLEPAAALVRQAAPALSDVLAELPGFATSARGTLGTARRVAPDLTRLGTRGTGDVARLGRTLERTASFAEAARPLSEGLGRGGVVAGVLHVMQNWDRTINGGDGIGRFFRLRAVMTPSALTSLVTRLTRKPAMRGRRPQRRPALGKPPVPAAPKPALPEAVGGATEPLREPLRNTVRQTQALLDYLLK